MKIVIPAPSGQAEVSYIDLLESIDIVDGMAVCEYRGNVLPPGAIEFVEPEPPELP